MIGWMLRQPVPSSDGAKLLRTFVGALVVMCLAADAVVAVIAFTRGGSPPVGTVISAAGCLVLLTGWIRPTPTRPTCACRSARPIERDLSGHRYGCPNHPPPRAFPTGG